MSNRKRRRDAPMPASSAGLLRFFEDETQGVKVRPEIVVAVSGILIAISILIRILLPLG
jgi:preprotein translocase subunit Sec61beta